MSIDFESSRLEYSNNFENKSSVTIYYQLDKKRHRLGEFQIHSARNSLKFRFYFDTLLSLSESLSNK